MSIRSALTSLFTYSRNPPRISLPACESSRPRRQSLIDRGCSKISFNMKCSNPPFSIASSSMSTFWIYGVRGRLEVFVILSFPSADHSNFLIVQIHHFIGIFDYWCCIGCEEKFVFADANQREDYLFVAATRRSGSSMKELQWHKPQPLLSTRALPLLPMRNSSFS